MFEFEHKPNEEQLDNRVQYSFWSKEEVEIYKEDKRSLGMIKAKGKISELVMWKD